MKVYLVIVFSFKDLLYAKELSGGRHVYDIDKCFVIFHLILSTHPQKQISSTIMFSQDSIMYYVVRRSKHVMITKTAIRYFTAISRDKKCVGNMFLWC